MGWIKRHKPAALAIALSCMAAIGLWAWQQRDGNADSPRTWVVYAEQHGKITVITKTSKIPASFAESGIAEAFKQELVIGPDGSSPLIGWEHVETEEFTTKPGTRGTFQKKDTMTYQALRRPDGRLQLFRSGQIMMDGAESIKRLQKAAREYAENDFKFAARFRALAASP